MSSPNRDIGKLIEAVQLTEEEKRILLEQITDSRVPLEALIAVAEAEDKPDEQAAFLAASVARMILNMREQGWTVEPPAVRH